MTNVSESEYIQPIGDSKGGPRWAMAPQIFAWPPVFPPVFS